MEPLTILKNDYATLLYHPDTKIIHHTFHKHTTGEAFRELLSCGTDAFIQHGASKWLSDDRKNMDVTPEDSAWGDQVWFPRTLQAGWKYWALVVPEDIMARWNMVQFVEKFSAQGIRVMVFTNPEEAMDWLDSF
jgi:hypothetical protein